MIATDAANERCSNVLPLARMCPKLGNGGEVVNLLTRAKINSQKRHSALPLHERCHDPLLEPVDIDSDFDRVNYSAANLAAKLFEAVVNSNTIFKKLEWYQSIARRCCFMVKEPQEAKDLTPTCFVLKGTPGSSNCLNTNAND